MFATTDLGGRTVYINPTAIVRVRRALAGNAGGKTVIEYGGEHAEVKEDGQTFVASLNGKPKLIEIKALDGSSVWLNPSSITTVQPALPGDGGKTRITAGKTVQLTAMEPKDVAALVP